MDITLPNHSGLFSIVKCTYGLQILQLLRIYIKTLKKTSSINEHIIFNQRCRRYHILPSHVQIKPPVRTALGYRIVQDCAFKFLSACIRDGFVSKRRLGQDLFFQKRQLEFVLHPSHFLVFTAYCNNVQEKEKSRCKDRQKKKFEQLLSKQNSRHHSSGKQWVVNLSSCTKLDLCAV